MLFHSQNVLMWVICLSPKSREVKGAVGRCYFRGRGTSRVNLLPHQGCHWPIQYTCLPITEAACANSRFIVPPFWSVKDMIKIVVLKPIYSKVTTNGTNIPPQVKGWGCRKPGALLHFSPLRNSPLDSPSVYWEPWPVHTQCLTLGQ